MAEQARTLTRPYQTVQLIGSMHYPSIPNYNQHKREGISLCTNDANRAHTAEVRSR